MSRVLAVIDLDAIEGEILREVVMSAQEMARMNEARAAFSALRSILMAEVVPALGGWDSPVAAEIERRLETITLSSRNFLWPHRHAGAAHDAVHVEAFR